jgi:hypothetical protein
VQKPADREAQKEKKKREGEKRERIHMRRKEAATALSKQGGAPIIPTATPFTRHTPPYFCTTVFQE